jgi:hypothetical protein
VRPRRELRRRREGAVLGELLSLIASSALGTVMERALDAVLERVPLPRRRVRPPVGWEARVERHCGDMRILGLVTEEPEIEVVDTPLLSPEDEALREELLPTLPFNDAHGLLVEPPMLDHSPLCLRVAATDYAGLEVLRRRDRHVGILSAGALLACPATRQLILHHRSRYSRTYPDHLHVIGGAYMPPTSRYGRADGASLISTAQREVLEETRAAITLDDDPPILVAEEPSTRFFQFVLLGVPISAKQVGMMRKNWEGEGIVRVGFDELERWLTRPPVPWVPTGKGHVLAWLALGAPGAGRRPRFGGSTARALFERVVSAGAAPTPLRTNLAQPPAHPSSIHPPGPEGP